MTATIRIKEAGKMRGTVALGAAFALCGALALCNGAAAMADPAIAPEAAQVPADAGSARADAAQPQAPAAKRPKMTAEEVRAAIAAAEKQRLAKTRPDPELSKVLREQWGVEVIGINRTSAGYMLDFRFRVVDAEKALPLFDHRIKPYVLTDRAHIKLPVPMAPKVGAFRPTNRGKNIKADKTYYMVFANPDSFVKPGEKVSVVIGDFRAENLTVH